MIKDKYKKSAKNTIDLQISGLRKLKKKIGNSFNKAVRAIGDCQSKCILVGVGKSGHLANLIASSLSSIGASSFALQSAANAVHGDLGVISSYPKKDVLKCFSLNLFPLYDIIKKFQQNLKKNKGSIVLFSTVAVKQGFPNHSIISPVKASLEGLTVSLASELSPNVRVNCIAPSMSNSKMANKILKNPKIAEGIAKQHPLRRLGEGNDSASLAKFLLSDESSWITGQIIGVDGGRSNIG